MSCGCRLREAVAGAAAQSRRGRVAARPGHGGRSDPRRPDLPADRLVRSPRHRHRRTRGADHRCLALPGAAGPGRPAKALALTAAASCARAWGTTRPGPAVTVSCERSASLTNRAALCVSVSVTKLAVGDAPNGRSAAVAGPRVLEITDLGCLYTASACIRRPPVCGGWFGRGGRVAGHGQG